MRIPQREKLEYRNNNNTPCSVTLNEIIVRVIFAIVYWTTIIIFSAD